jgi:hypothetical protein
MILSPKHRFKFQRRRINSNDMSRDISRETRNCAENDEEEDRSAHCGMSCVFGIAEYLSLSMSVDIPVAGSKTIVSEPIELARETITAGLMTARR